MILLAALITAKVIAGPIEATVESVYDGDTFTAKIYTWPGEVHESEVRVLGVDTPEIHGKCDAEKDAAQKAKARMIELLKGKILLYGIREDKYGGRVEAYVEVDGKRVDHILIEEGLGRLYMGEHRPGWCK
jgi:endonuclease YncB( thermonuclease family)